MEGDEMVLIGKGEVVFLGRTFKEALKDIVTFCPTLVDLREQAFTISWEEEAAFDKYLRSMFWIADLSTLLEGAYREAGVACARIQGSLLVTDDTISISFIGHA